MKRFRITLFVICCFLVFLGGSDAWVWLHNRQPLVLTAEAVYQGVPLRNWVAVEDAHMDILGAVSTSGRVELEALLVPILPSSDSREPIRLMLETRDEVALGLFGKYHFLSETAEARKDFLREYKETLNQPRRVQGMITGSLIARGNRTKLLELARESGLQVADDVEFLTEGKEPAPVRGALFLLVALAGLVKLVSTFLRDRQLAEQPRFPTGQ